MTCATCKNWNPKKTAPAMARLKLANCLHCPSWSYLPPHGTCPRYTPAAAEVVEVRMKWLAPAGRQR
jgi:hypothetical protein